MQAQAVLLQPLRQHPKHPPRVVLVLEHQHRVIGVTDLKGDAGAVLLQPFASTPQLAVLTDLKGPSSQPRLHFVFEPLVQHLMQIDVTQRRIWEPYDYGNLSLCGR